MAYDTYEYPRGIGKVVKAGEHFLLLTSYESKNALDSVGHSFAAGTGGNDGTTAVNTAKAISSIALYIPPNSLKTSFNANYGDMEGGFRTAAGMTAMNNFSETGVMDILKGVGVTITEKAAQVADKGTGMLSAGRGMAVNNHVALVYKGPTQFRTHEFSFSFFPKDKDGKDSDMIKAIIADFQNGMLPRMMGGFKGTRKLSAPFFQSPRHWILKFCMGGDKASENPYLFQIGKSVITDMTVNHDQQSMVSFHPDGAPIQTTLNLTFKEIEFQTSGDSMGGEIAKERKQITNDANMTLAKKKQKAQENG